MQAPPPQYSPDGLFWWDGARWVPRAVVPPALAPALAPAYPPAAPYYSSLPSFLRPAPGLRIVLIVCLSLVVAATGFFASVFIIAAFTGAHTALDFVLGFAVLGMFALSGLALLGVAIRASWSRWLAVAAGILICWTLVGLILGIPIVIAAARAPDLSQQRAA